MPWICYIFLSLAMPSIIFVCGVSSESERGPTFSTNVLVVSGVGVGVGKKTEIWSHPQTTKTQCPLPDFPFKVNGAVGFMTALGPAMCGGWREKRCFVLNQHQWTPLPNMINERYAASAIEVDKHQTLIIGGYGGSKTTELFSSTGTEEVNDFPVIITDHCTLKINSTHGLITGGKQDGSISASTWYVELTKLTFTPGPEMNVKRDGHGCAAFHMGNKTYGIASGGYNGNNDLDSTEIIDLEKDTPTWFEGPKLPRRLWRLKLVETRHGTFAMGGVDGERNRRSEVLLLWCFTQIRSCQWQEMDEKLEFGRSHYVVFPLLESDEICGPDGRSTVIDDEEAEYTDSYEDSPGYVHSQIRGNASFPSITQYPWMVSFQYEDMQTGNWYHYCGGAIIGKNSIATASHCFFSNEAKYFIHTKIRSGDQNFTDTTDFDNFVKTYEISTIIKHPGYQGFGPKNDLAIVFTKTEIEFNIVTNSIALPSLDDPIRAPNTNYSAKFTGYGYFDNTTTTSDALREADFTIYTGTYCEPLYRNTKIKNHLVNTSIMICAGAADNSTWTCAGDSGGPLVHEWRQEYILLGVLHGSRADKYTCDPTTAKNPSLFANLEEPGNLEFLLKWKKLGSFFLKDNLKDLDNQTSLSINYLEHLGPSPVTQSLWRNYTKNEDIYSVIFFKLCQNSTTATTIVDCSLYNLKITQICQNGNSGKDNLEMYGVDCTMSKLLILTGWPSRKAKEIEVVDLQNPLNSCSLPEEFPTRLTTAVGGFTNDGPLLCSGYNLDTDFSSNACFTLKNSKFTEAEIKMQTERNSASAVVLPNGELWIQGGWDGNKRLSTTETISLEGSQTGMELEKGIFGHCSMMINATTAFITGGWTGSYSKDTYFVDIHNWKWTKGPQMEERRAYPGCVLFMHNNHNYALVAGGEYPSLSSTEILDLDSGILEWTKGPELPVEMFDFPLVSTSQGIMAVGGYDNTNGRNKDEILHLKCQDGQDPNQCKWAEYPKKLDVARVSHVVIPLPASYEICNN